jgi:hypothetical protein
MKFVSSSNFQHLSAPEVAFARKNKFLSLCLKQRCKSFVHVVWSLAVSSNPMERFKGWNKPIVEILKHSDTADMPKGTFQRARL